MNKRCTLITVKENDIGIIKIILGADNTFGPMGSGGYTIRQEKEIPRGVTVITFIELGCRPAGKFVIFIKDGNIWATRMAGWVMDILNRKDISFSQQLSGNPPFVEEYMATQIA